MTSGRLVKTFFTEEKIYEVSMRFVYSKFNFRCFRFFIAYLIIVQLRFLYCLLHCGYMEDILTVVRACPQTQLDYSN